MRHPFDEECAQFATVEIVRQLHEQRGCLKGVLAMGARLVNIQSTPGQHRTGLDLYPEALRPAIDEVNAWVYPAINNGVYRCGFATSQEAYDVAFEVRSTAGLVYVVPNTSRVLFMRELFFALDRCESILSRHRAYICLMPIF